LFAWIDAQGSSAVARAQGSVGVMAVCVHRRLPTNVAVRLAFIDTVLAIAAAATEEQPVFIALPGGFFGFDAELWYQHTQPGDPDPWGGLAFTVAQAAAVRAHVQTGLDRLPPGSAIVFGSDLSGANSDQAACLIQRQTPARVIHRTSTPLANRHVQVGPVRATVFVCGEFTGSDTPPNGPFNGNALLQDPANALPTTSLLVDLAHAHVRSQSGPVARGVMFAPVHQRQMEAFSPIGASVLVHHHGGELTAGRARNDAASNWVLFRGGQWIGDEEVHLIP
jgi:hypothetical protein